MKEIDDLDARQTEPLLTNETYFDFTDEYTRFRRLKVDMLSYRELALEAAGGWNICETLYNFYMYCISGTYLQYMAKSVAFSIYTAFRNLHTGALPYPSR